MKLPEIPQSLWLSTRPMPELARLEGEITVDVAIIGAGITGLTAALPLVRAGKTVAVIEARRVAEGVTGHTTAHLTEAVDARYAALEHDFGEDGARLVAESSRAAIAEIERIVTSETIACELRRVPGFLYTEAADATALEAELEAAKRAGVRASLTRDVPLPFARVAIRYEDQAKMHPRNYAVGIAERVLALGGRIFEGTRFVHLEEGAPHRVVTDHGVVHAAHVVFATHTPLNRFALQMKLARYQSYAVAFAAPASAPDGLFWDTEDPYHYIRTQEVGDATLLVVGGEDHKTGQEGCTGERYAALAQYAQSRFGVESMHFMWSAQVIESVDGLPYIGLSPHAESVYVATGYAGNGITFGTLAGMMLSDAILGRTNAYAELYSPARIKPIAAAKDFVLENLDVPVHYIGDRLKRLSAPGLDEVAPGEGKIVRHDGHLLAVYRDDDGCAHALGPKCPHMGCIVAFNAAEKTWDCPCHGSRFGVDGHVLDGPATTALVSKTLTPEGEKKGARPHGEKRAPELASTSTTRAHPSASARSPRSSSTRRAPRRP